MDASRPNASSLERVDGDCNDYVSLANAPKDLLGAVLCGERRRSTVGDEIDGDGYCLMPSWPRR